MVSLSKGAFQRIRRVATQFPSSVRSSFDKLRTNGRGGFWRCVCPVLLSPILRAILSRREKDQVS